MKKDKFIEKRKLLQVERVSYLWGKLDGNALDILMLIHVEPHILLQGFGWRVQGLEVVRS